MRTQKCSLATENDEEFSLVNKQGRFKYISQKNRKHTFLVIYVESHKNEM